MRMKTITVAPLLRSLGCWADHTEGSREAAGSPLRSSRKRWGALDVGESVKTDWETAERHGAWWRLGCALPGKGSMRNDSQALTNTTGRAVGPLEDTGNAGHKTACDSPGLLGMKRCPLPRHQYRLISIRLASSHILCSLLTGLQSHKTLSVLWGS